MPDLMTSAVAALPGSAGELSGNRPVVILDSERLRQVRRERGLSQERLAYRAKVSLTTVARLERQSFSACRAVTVARLAAALSDDPTAMISTLLASAERWPERCRAASLSEQAIPAAPLPSWRCSRTFPARPDQVAVVRAFFGRVLGGWPLMDDAILICSELATNAVLHSGSSKPGGYFSVHTEVREGDYLWIEVEDQGGRWIEDRNSADLGGRGLEIVTAIADYWDVRGDEDGRVVCARLDWPAPEQ